jgi:hypothetical protein
MRDPHKTDSVTGLLVVACGLLAYGPAVYAQPDTGPPVADQHTRAIFLRNLCGQPMVSALARTTDGQTRVLTYEPVQPGQGRWIVLPRQQCLESVTVHLNNGRVLQADRLNECRPAAIVVSDGGIALRSSAQPGRRQPH